MRPSLPLLLGKFALAAGWLAAAGIAAWTRLNETPAAHDTAAAVFMLGAPVVWLVSKAVAVSRSDEVERSVAFRGLATGLLFASVWPGIMIGGSVLSSLFLGDGRVNVGGMMQNAVTYAAIMPPIAFFLSELSIYAMLAVYGRSSD